MTSFKQRKIKFKPKIKRNHYRVYFYRALYTAAICCLAKPHLNLNYKKEAPKPSPSLYYAFKPCALRVRQVDKKNCGNFSNLAMISEPPGRRAGPWKKIYRPLTVPCDKLREELNCTFAFHVFSSVGL